MAKLLLKPANVLVLDEPTNDLDMATLELLEDFVVNFKGTVLLISHDRAFMDNVVTQTWVFDTDKYGDGIVLEYVGGYEDYVQQHERWLAHHATDNKPKATKPAEPIQIKPPQSGVAQKNANSAIKSSVNLKICLMKLLHLNKSRHSLPKKD